MKRAILLQLLIEKLEKVLIRSFIPLKTLKELQLRLDASNPMRDSRVKQLEEELDLHAKQAFKACGFGREKRGKRLEQIRAEQQIAIAQCTPRAARRLGGRCSAPRCAPCRARTWRAASAAAGGARSPARSKSTEHLRCLKEMIISKCDTGHFLYYDYVTTTT